MELVFRVDGIGIVLLKTQAPKCPMTRLTARFTGSLVNWLIG